MKGELYLTDGITRINLKDGIDGYYLYSWVPKTSQLKGGGVSIDSPLSDGNMPAMGRWDNTIETFIMHVSRFSQDDVIHDLQDLRRLLLAAREYFYGVIDTPVWIEARGDQETNSRYAVVVAWQAIDDGDPYHTPFLLDHPAIAGFTLSVERQHWCHLPPGQTECVELSATQDYYDEQNDDFAPAERDDDGYVDTVASAITLNGNLRFGRTAASAQIYESGIRFKSVSIPQGAYIVRAYIKLTADANLAGSTVNVLLTCDDVDNSAIFSTYADFAGRARTTANVAWSPGIWVSGTAYDTPDIASAVQEVVQRAGWVSGNSLSVLIDDNTSTAGAYRTADSWDGANDPVLYIWWVDAAHTLTFGRAATCTNEVYVANKHNKAQITHIFIDDGGVFGTNLQGSALPYALLPAAPAVNDAVYFGIATNVGDSGPFCSLVFDIGTRNEDDTIVWEAWTGAAWAALTVRDNTNANGYMTGNTFDTAGVNSVSWDQYMAGGWDETLVNGVNGWWVRARVTAIAGAVAAPTQQSRHIYTVVIPYIDTVSTEVWGDIPALAKLVAEGQYGNSNLIGPIQTYLGLRSYDRGPNFSAYLNLANEQNPAGVVMTINAAAGIASASSAYTPSGQGVTWSTGGAAGEAWLLYLTIPSTLTADYTGEFRCFLRLVGTAATELYRLKICANDYNTVIYQTGQIAPPTLIATRWSIMDFGKITLPPLRVDSGDTVNNTIIRLDGQALGIASASLSDFILLPTDECFLDSSSDDLSIGYRRLGLYTQIRQLYADSTIPRRQIKSDLRDASTGYVLYPWTNRIVGPLTWQPNVRQRWWFFQTSIYTTSTKIPQVENLLSVQGFQVSRYLSMRGNR